MFSSADAKTSQAKDQRSKEAFVLALSLFLLPPKSGRLICRRQDDQTPLHISSRLGKQDIVQQLLANGACPDATTSSGYTPLHLAAREGHRDVAATLLDNGANLSIITKVPRSPDATQT